MPASSEITNINKILGDQNVSLQNITANDIKIITGREENPEVSAKKNQIAEQIALMIQKLDASMIEQLVAEPTLTTDDFEDIDFDDLVDAVSFGNCILFIGPELSLNESGGSLHEKFYESISKKNMEYDPEDHFFMPGSETKLTNRMKRYYSNTFHDENKAGYKILEKLASIPFHLIVSAAPDDTLHRIFDEHNIEHTFVHYNGDEQEVPEPTKEHPIIYNFMGNPAANGKYIFTFQQFHDYIKQKQLTKVPLNIEAKVSEAVHYLFVGFDFEKWYNRLALLSFKLNPETESFTFAQSKMTENIKEFIHKQFNISYIDQNYNDFVDVLLHETHQAGLSKSLQEVFVQNTLNALERIRVKTIDINKLELLMEVEQDMNRMKEKYFHH